MGAPGFFTRNKRWLLPLIILLLAVLAVVMMVALRPSPPQKAPHNKVSVVDVKPVVMAPMQLTVRSQGMLAPQYSTELVAQVSGEVIHIARAFERGGMVNKGDVLATIDPTNYHVKVEQAKASLASAKAALEQEQAQGQVAKTEWEDVHNTPPPALGLRKPQLAQAKAQVRAAAAALKQAEKDLSRTRITAPYQALVGARDVSLGSFVSVGKTIGKVFKISSAEVRLPLTGADQAYLKGTGVGARVALTSSVNGRAHTWQARIVRREAVVDENTRMRYLVARVSDPYNVHSKHKNAGNILPFGSYVVAHIAGKTLPHATLVERALIKNNRVGVAKNGKLQLKKVTVLRHQEGMSVVTSGLQTGDQLITSALELPVDGMALKVNKNRKSNIDNKVNNKTKPPSLTPANNTQATSPKTSGAQ